MVIIFFGTKYDEIIGNFNFLFFLKIKNLSDYFDLSEFRQANKTFQRFIIFLLFFFFVIRFTFKSIQFLIVWFLFFLNKIHTSSKYK